MHSVCSAGGSVAPPSSAKAGAAGGRHGERQWEVCGSGSCDSWLEILPGLEGASTCRRLHVLPHRCTQPHLEGRSGAPQQAQLPGRAAQAWAPQQSAERRAPAASGERRHRAGKRRVVGQARSLPPLSMDAKCHPAAATKGFGPRQAAQQGDEPAFKLPAPGCKACAGCAHLLPGRPRGLVVDRGARDAAGEHVGGFSVGIECWGFGIPRGWALGRCRPAQ